MRVYHTLSSAHVIASYGIGLFMTESTLIASKSMLILSLPQQSMQMYAYNALFVIHYYYWFPFSNALIFRHYRFADDDVVLSLQQET